MSAGAISCPAVFRGPNGAAAGVAAQHSQCYAAWYASVPGLKVLAPYDAEDARGLLKAAIRDPDPVIFLENEILYGESFPVTPAVLDKDFTVPIGKAKVMREGSDVTLLAFGKMVGYCLAAADALAAAGVSAEVVNLRSLRPLDSDTVLASVRKTHRAVTVEEGWPVCGVGAELAALIGEHAFDDLDAPIRRLNGKPSPTPYSPTLEAAVVPDAEAIATAEALGITEAPSQKTQGLLEQHPELYLDYEEAVLEKLVIREAYPPIGNPTEDGKMPNHTTYPFLTLYERTKILSISLCLTVPSIDNRCLNQELAKLSFH
jgi:pyruvate/2-oxoglutarate/acetoin dehydrogenase E1 component